ncbi:hypothetical protein ACN47E_008248 [Coniothyrium glycines]
MASYTLRDRIYVTGLAHEYPTHAIRQCDFENIVRTLYPACDTSIGLQKLIQFNARTGIDARPTVQDSSLLTQRDVDPPKINEISQVFRTMGVELARAASRRALLEARVSSHDITHVVAVTCTDQGNPGYELLLCQKLGLPSNVERTLLHGVGCAGGLSALRAASNLAASASQRGQAARILVVACELCSLFFRLELQAAQQDSSSLHIAPGLFSDAAAAVIVCNGLALGNSQKPIFELQASGTMVVPNTTAQMSYDIQSHGMVAYISKDVPKTAISAIAPLFNKLEASISNTNGSKVRAPADSHKFDWAIHPGGAAILKGAQKAMDLTDDHIRSSLEVYKNFGNSSSAAVLVVLDKLRQIQGGREQVVATSFGPGVTIEMILMKRCSISNPTARPTPVQSEKHTPWLPLYSRLARAYRRLAAISTSGRGPRKLRPMVQ